MKSITFLTLLLFVTVHLFGQEIENPVTDLEFKSSVSVEGDLKNGTTISLDWAQKSSVACFPGVKFAEFQGNHVFYRIEMPPASDMEIMVTPKSKKTRINVYALRLGVDNMACPPDITRAISCEASYPAYVGKPNLKTAAKPQSVEYMSITKPYAILIGVAGAKEVLEGAFELNIKTKSR